MANYLLIFSRDPFEDGRADMFTELAVNLHRNGETVRIFLVQNGVNAARAHAGCDFLDRLVRGEIQVLADEFSMRERALHSSDLSEGVAPVPIDIVVDALAAGEKVIWR